MLERSLNIGTYQFRRPERHFLKGIKKMIKAIKQNLINQSSKTYKLGDRIQEITKNKRKKIILEKKTELEGTIEQTDNRR